MIAHYREPYIKAVQENVVRMLQKQPPVSPIGLIFADDDYKAAGRIIGEIYVDMVWNFLENHPYVMAGQRWPYKTGQGNKL